jgi:hypothetical protein
LTTVNILKNVKEIRVLRKENERIALKIQNNKIIKNGMTDADAMFIGKKLGFIDKVAKKKARRFYGYLKGEINNWDYNDIIHYGNITEIIIPILIYMKEHNIEIPNIEIPNIKK